ncbi:MAG TPA: metallophosphoesterase [Candidatus Lumbricidophila sp.]|nr:metallophosphoesterase [Candidatus Lumbricidophila sp.]
MGFGIFGDARYTVAHLSDPHLCANGAWLGGKVDTMANLRAAGERLRARGSGLDAIVVTGDITDLGEPDAYRIAREVLGPVAGELGAELIWVIGNHDERQTFHQMLLGESSDAPVHLVRWVDSLRIIAIDVSVPGFHHGEFTEEAAAWLQTQLADTAPSGTVLAMHHAPIASPVGLMDVLELRGQGRLAEVVRGSDIRIILGGHLHYPTNGTFAGIPVAVAGATAYSIDIAASPRELVGSDGGQSFSLVHLGADWVTTSVVPLEAATRVSHFPAELLDELEQVDDAGRLARFSKKPA